MSYRLKSTIFWILSFLLMAGAAIHQRGTGPTYPVRGKLQVGQDEIKYRLIRTWEGDTDAAVKVKAENPEIEGQYRFKRFRSNDDWSEKLPMVREGVDLVAYLPNLPPAGKMTYEIFIGKEGNFANLTSTPPVLRYKGIVPKAVLFPHILIIFLAMMFSTRAGIEALTNGKNTLKYAMWTVLLFGVGGMIFGPIIQKFAFGAFWTGWPFGTDLTDNKSLATFLIWVVAWLQVRKNPRRRGWVIVAALALLMTFLIPHSMMGSELDFTEIDAQEIVK
ncbi:MAG: hypothetical protein IH598_11605 [Bacteroidales bacterium]|nr:hypothetical protein [Bacteroidales bacterium]